MLHTKSMAPKHCEQCPSRDRGVFCSLGQNALAMLSEHKVENTYKKGQTLFVEGNPPYGIYCVAKGNIKIRKMTENGKESIVRIASDGDVIGHRSIFTEHNYSATATTLEDSQVCFIDKKYVLKLVQEQPTVAYNLIEKLSRDLGASEQKIASFSHKNVREKLAELLLVLKTSHGINEGEKIRLDIKLTREEMASLIGTATETLIRVLSEFKDESLIDQKGKILFILNEQRLLETAQINY